MNWQTNLVLVATCVSMAACGGKQDDPSTHDAGADASHPADASPAGPDCPTTQPQPSDGASCSKEGLECEYGDDARYTCNAIATCNHGNWDVSTSNDVFCPTPTPNPAACPASYASAQQGSACSDTSVPCHYAEGWCSCIFVGGPPLPDGGNSPSSIWMCGNALSSGCPATRPRLGTACTQSELECDYSPCGVPQGLSVRCDATTHTWSTGFGGVCAGAN